MAFYITHRGQDGRVENYGQKVPLPGPGYHRERFSKRPWDDEAQKRIDAGAPVFWDEQKEEVTVGDAPPPPPPPPPTPTEEERGELRALIAKENYAAARARQYPTMGDQIDAVLKHFETQKLAADSPLLPVIANWKAVKEAHPKPTEEETAKLAAMRKKFGIPAPEAPQEPPK